MVIFVGFAMNPASDPARVLKRVELARTVGGKSLQTFDFSEYFSEAGKP